MERRTNLTPVQLSLFSLIILLVAQTANSKPDTKLELSLQEAGKTNYEHAIQLLKEHLQKDSTVTELYVRLADYYRYSEKLTDGRTYFQDAIETTPDNPNLYVGYAQLSKHANDWKAVFNHAKLALEKESTSALAVDALIQSALETRRTRTLPRLLRKLRREKEQKHLYELGYAFWRFRIDNYKKTKKTLVQYLKDREDAHAHALLGRVHYKLNDFQASVSHYLRAHDLAHSNMLEFDIRNLTGLSETYFQMGKLDSAEHYYSHAIEKAQQYGALFEALEIELSRYRMYRKTEQHPKLVDACSRGIAIAIQINDSTALPTFYLGSADAHYEMGDYQKAMNNYAAAAKQAELLHNTRVQTDALLRIGEIHAYLQNWAEALSHLTQGLQIATDARHYNLQYWGLLKMGEVQQALGSIEEAGEAYKRVLRYSQRIQKHQLTGTCFFKLANLYLNPAANLSNADYYLTLANQLAKQTFRLRYAANIRWMRGKLALIRNDIETAETYFLKAIQLGQETGSYVSILAGNAGLIRTYLEAGFPDLAAARADSTLNFFKEFASLCLDENSMEFFEPKYELFLPAVDAYAKIGDLAKIYEVCELYKTVQSIKELSKIRYRIRTSPGDRVRRKIDKIDAQIRQKWTTLWELWREDKRDNLKMVTRIREEINQLVKDRRILRTRLANSHPEYYQLFYPSDGSLYDLRAWLKEIDGSYVHYLVGKQATNILVVRADSIYFKRVNSGSRYFVRLLESLAGAKTTACIAKEQNFRVDLAGKFYDSIFNPVRGWIPPQSKLIVSPDDVLRCLPFEALVTNTQDLESIHDYEHAKFLIEDYHISYASSEQFLRFHQNQKGRTKKNFIAFANSVQPDEAKLSPGNGANGNGYTKLPNSITLEDEIDQIMEAVGDTRVTRYVNERSTTDRFMNESFKYKIVHLSLPAVLQKGSELYTKFVFHNSPRQNEFVEMYELFNLKLQSELLVLNANNHRWGSPGTFESLETLSAALNYSGGTSLISNLWTIPRQQATKFMESFYSNLRAGMDKADAIRNAKITFLKNSDRNPYYWASFILLGNAAPVEFYSINLELIIVFTLVVVFTLAGLVLWQYLRIKKERAT
ncbi:CHAT domain-containing protein [candidate division KSB1 bacterium]|nr:CHAT domain-containing protein [candidate division KSB1 bacterium]NIR69742.1 CHAT domain-containing protein [candidate division KSB1 bacterium]NIS22930.1 CHAT domain-containing protein [candidate division KSB1 bacterium]NIT69787.1 CHAT domain-containing protein [candidate division KSB1 bacterium]NIU23461.1 CHAT domain-containing protein [candidate division KSB1 bacterium]